MSQTSISPSPRVGKGLRASLPLAVASALAVHLVSGWCAAMPPRLVLATADPQGPETAELAQALEAHLSGLGVTVERARAESRGAASMAASRDKAMLVWMSADRAHIVFESAADGRSTSIIANGAGERGWTATCEVIASRILPLVLAELSARDETAPSKQPSAQLEAPRPKPREETVPSDVGAEEPAEEASEEAKQAVLTPPVETPREEGPVVVSGGDWLVGVAGRVGVYLPTSALGPFVVAGVNVELAIASAGRMLSVAIDATFTRPSFAGAFEDARFGRVAHETTVYQTKLSVDLQLRLPGRDARLCALIGAGPALQHMLIEQTSSLASFAVREERLEFGGEVLLGAALRLGLGHVLLEARYVVTDLDTPLTGDTNAGGVGLSVGYQLVF